VAIMLAVFALEPAAPRADVPPGLAYDEVVRLTVDATPPPPAAFAEDVATLAEAGRHRRLDRAAERRLRDAAGWWADRLTAFFPGRLQRVAIWNDWERTDDLAAHTAVIRKCDVHQTIDLDLAHRTFRVVPDPTPPPQAPAGTVQALLDEQVTALGPTPGGDAVGEGYVTTAEFTLAQPSGPCRGGTAVFNETAVYDRRTPPPLSCPIVAGNEPLLEAPVQFIAAGGCRPMLSAAKGGPVPPDWHFALYRSIATGPVAVTVERGNVHVLGPNDAALFEIPPGFTLVRP
jgi:hypothetical protein